jgi:uncharacterized membrane protein YbaN (DUF454 family)
MRIGKKPAGNPKVESAEVTGRGPVDLNIEISEGSGLIRVVDSRLFRADRRDWCRSLAEAAATRRGVHAVSLDLETATCEIQFAVGRSAPAPSARSMADVFAAAMGEANASNVGPETPRGRSSRWLSRRPQAWSSLTAFAGEGTASVWEADLPEPGSIRIRHQVFLNQRTLGSRLACGLKTDFEGLSVCRFDRRTRGLEVQFEPGSLDVPRLLQAAEDRLAALRLASEGSVPASTWLPAKYSPGEPAILVSGPRRVLYLGLGCGAVAMIFVGLSVPGVPTVTFAIAASYYLARSSIRLHDRVVRSRLFGPIVREWITRHGLSLRSKLKLIALTGALVIVSFLLVPITPLVLAVTFVLSSGGVYSILRMPGIDEESDILPIPSIPRALPVSSV